MAPTIAITGSASGIGASIARLYASKGYNLVLSDHAADLLSQTSSLIQSRFPSVQILTKQADVSNVADLVALKDAALARFDSIDVVVLNAGVHGDYKVADQQGGWWGNPQAIKQLYDVNLFGVINGIHAFLPSLRTQTPQSSSSSLVHKRIVITGSKQGITNPPGNPAYNSSKAAIRYLAEQLSFELKDELVNVHLLVPGWTFTGIVGGPVGAVFDQQDNNEHDGATTTLTKPAGAWTSDQVAEYLQAGIEREEFYIICPDNETSEQTDQVRMAWTAGDLTSRRPPLSRWRPEFKQEFEKFAADYNNKK
ncbi:hypothetical protein V1514DRAFT_334592 [Lipomyces japonicus]|uniref:uncharacterized protein n=1 Tax=Lipomyces japonicus TaxID=56871 RepID=UPI0034CE2932